MNVDTGAFAVLTGRLDDLERQVAALVVHAGMLGAIPDSRPARARRAARHLRAVNGSAS